jgi:hypothetical protein
MTSIFYNFIWGVDFEPTSLLRHQKYLMLKQLVDSNKTLKLKSVADENRKAAEREASFITLIKNRKKARNFVVLKKK